jgi:hypothetical protein
MVNRPQVCDLRAVWFFIRLKEHEPLLKNSGKFKIGKACIYVNKLADIDKQKITLLMKASIKFLKRSTGELEINNYHYYLY